MKPRRIRIVGLFAFWLFAGAAQATDLTVDKKADNEEFTVEDEITFTITVTATGVNAVNVTVSDILPPGFDINSSVTVSGGGTCNVTETADDTADTIVCNAASLSAGSKLVISFIAVYTGDDPFGTSFTNGATASADNEINPGNNTDSVDVTYVTPESLGGGDNDGGCSLIRSR